MFEACCAEYCSGWLISASDGALEHGKQIWWTYNFMLMHTLYRSSIMPGECQLRHVREVILTFVEEAKSLVVGFNVLRDLRQFNFFRRSSPVSGPNIFAVSQNYLKHRAADMFISRPVGPASGKPAYIDILKSLQTLHVYFGRWTLPGRCSSCQGTFWRLAHHHIARGLVVPIRDTVDFLTRADDSCVVAKATAYLAMAEHSRSLGDELEARKNLEGAERQLAYLRSSKAPLYELITEPWPLLALWRRVSEALAMKSPPAPISTPQPLVVVCCSRFVRAALSKSCVREGWTFLYIGERCKLSSVLSRLNREPVLVLSPWLRFWDELQAHRVRTTLQWFHELNLQIAGFPTVDSNSFWQWPLRRLTWRRPFRLHYETYPTGYVDSRGGVCFEGQATSGSRLFRADVLKSLGTRLAGAGQMASWLAAVDLEAAHVGIPMHTCMAEPWLEDNYLTMAALTPFIARRFEIEEASFSPGLPIQRTCLAGSDVRISPCVRSSVFELITSIVSWWLSLAPGNAAAVSGPLQAAVQYGCDTSDTRCPLPVDEQGCVGILELLSPQGILRKHPFNSSSFSPEESVVTAGRGCLRVKARVSGEYTIWSWIGNVKVFLASPVTPLLQQETRTVTVLNCTESCISAMLLLLEESDEKLIAVVSPWVQTEKSLLNAQLQRAAWYFENPSVQIVGFPNVDNKLEWRWPLRQLRRQYWKLHYRRDPAGHGSLAPPVWSATASGFTTSIPAAAVPRCFAGHATSSTRLFRLGALRRLGAEGSLLPLGAEDFVSWLVGIDLEASRLGIDVYTCLGEPLEDDDYLDYAVLTPRLSQRFEIEVARFTESRQSKHCLDETASGLGDGIVRRWCVRKQIMGESAVKAAEWLAQSPEHFWCLAHGGFLSLFRGGDSGMMPWDNDVDTHECSTGEVFDLEDPSSPPAEYRSHKPLSDFPYRFSLFGMFEVRFSQYWLDHHFFTQGSRYRNIAIKMHEYNVTSQTWRPLGCHVNHTACTPRCTPTRCEFEDLFVHTDHWDW